MTADNQDHLSAQTERRKTTPPGPIDFVQEKGDFVSTDVTGRPGIAIPRTGEQKTSEISTSKPESRRIRNHRDDTSNLKY
jgi:hypothetical protein